MDEENEGNEEGNIEILKVANGYILKPQNSGSLINQFVFIDKDALAAWIKVHGTGIPVPIDKKVENLPF